MTWIIYLILNSIKSYHSSSLKCITVSFHFSKGFRLVYHASKFGHAFAHLLLFGLLLGLIDLVVLPQARQKRLCILKRLILN